LVPFGNTSKLQASALLVWGQPAATWARPSRCIHLKGNTLATNGLTHNDRIGSLALSNDCSRRARSTAALGRSCSLLH